jgi:anti-sigma B factor antagonist
MRKAVAGQIRCRPCETVSIVQDHFRIESRREADAVVLVLSGELDVARAPRLEQELASAASGDARLIVLDLRGLEFMDSTGLRAVLTAYDAARDEGRGFGLVRGPQQVQRLLSLTRVADRLVIVDDPGELLVSN